MTTRTDLLQIKIESDGEGRVRASLAGISKDLGEIERSSQGAAGGVNVLSKALGAIGASAVATKVYQTVTEFERLSAVLRTLEGSEAGAAARMRELQDVASKTPAQLSEIIQAFSTLKSRGLDATREALLAYANVAAASGKTLQQFVEAVADASTGEMERLKEFGVVARQQGDQIAVTFRGVTTTIARDSAAITGYLREIGEVQFAGAAAEQMDTLGGAVSNLLDSVDRLIVAFGESGLSSALGSSIRQASRLVDVMTELTDKANDGDGLLGTLGRINQFVQGNLTFGVLGNRDPTALIFGGPEGEARDGRSRAAAGAAAREEAAATAELEQAQTALRDSTTALIAELERKTAALGASRVEVLALEKAEKLASATNDAEREAITRAYDALIAKAKALDVHGKAQATAEREVQRFIDALAEEAAAYGLSAEQLLRDEAARLKVIATTAEQRAVIDRLTDTVIRNRQAAQAQQVTMQAQQRAMADINRTLTEFESLLRDQAATLSGPVEAANQRYADTLALIAKRERELLELGPASDADMAAIAKARADAFTLHEQEMVEAERSARELALRQVDGWGRVLIDGAEDTKHALIDVLVGGGDLEDVGMRLARTMMAGFLEQLLDESMTKPMQDAIAGWFNDAQGQGGSGSGGFWEAIGNYFRGGNGASSGSGGFGGMSSGTTDFGAFGPGGGNWNQSFAPQGQQGGGGFQNPGVGGYVNAGMSAYAGWRNAAEGGSKGDTIMAFTAAGAAFGPWGALIGAVVGILVAVFKKAKPPDVRLGGSNSDVRDPEGSFSTVFGRVQAGSRILSYQDFIESIQKFDQQMLDMVREMGGTEEEIAAIRERLSNWSVDLIGDDATAENILSSRFNAIVGAIEPQWEGFLSRIASLQKRVEAFAQLHGIEEFVDGIEHSIAELSGDPLQRLRTEFHNLQSAVDTTTAALENAIAARDPKLILEAATAAEQAIIRRFTAEIEVVRALEDALLSAQQAARAIDVQLLQRIAQLGGGSADLVDTTHGHIGALRDQVTGATNPDRALGFLNQFVGAVDTWLQAATARVQELANAERALLQAELDGIYAERAAIESALGALVAERDQIMATARERTQAEMQAAQQRVQAAAEADRAAREAQLDMLRQQLGIAQQFGRVVEQTQSALDAMTFGSANPLGPMGQFEALGARVSDVDAQFQNASGAERAVLAGELVDLLGQRVQMAQSGLFDRSGGDYLAVFNQTRRRLSEVQADARPHADLERELQERIAALQEAGNGFGYTSSLNTGELVRLTSEEQTRIDAIAAAEAEAQARLAELAEQEAALQQELNDIQVRAEAAIQAINREALSYYQWARTEAQRLDGERQQAILDQLNELTGGRPVDEFIAERMAAATDLLTDIRDRLRAFLEAIENMPPFINVPIRGGPGDSAPGPVTQMPNSIGPTAGSSTGVQVTYAPVIQVAAGADAATVERTVRRVMQNDAPQFATLVKRHLRTA